MIQRVATTKPYVAITIDDFYTGDYRRETAIHMLEATNALRAQVTLCPAGSALTAFLRQYPDQAAQIRALVAAGSYELCNHTFSHPRMTQVGRTHGIPAEMREILDGQTAITRFFGRRPSPIFRPPFGLWDASLQHATASTGYGRIITWSVDSGDSEGPELAAERLVANVACARPGDIILMHANRRSSAAALPLIIRMLRAKGLEPVNISTLLASGRPVYTTRPSDMKHLYTCVRPPVMPKPSGTPRLATRAGSPSAPSAAVRPRPTAAPRVP